jgi:YidC/Oxa1 family membrane protein insertase
MNIKTIFTLSLACFLIFCSVLVVQSGLFDNQPQQTSGPFIRLSNTPESKVNTAIEEVTLQQAPEPTQNSNALELIYAKDPANPVLGSDVKDGDYKFKLELTSKGASIAKAILSEYDDRDPDDPKPLILLSPIDAGQGKTVYSFASGNLDLLDINRRYSLSDIDWKTGEVVSALDGTQSVTFEVSLGQTTRTEGVKLVKSEALKITKTYSIKPNSYDVDCDIKIENLSPNEVNARFDFQGPAGINREDARSDSRNITTAFITAENKLESVKTMAIKLRKPTKIRNTEKLKLTHKKAGPDFLWAASTNKYFAAILRPISSNNDATLKSLRLSLAEYYDPEIYAEKPDGNENVSFKVKAENVKLGTAESGDNVLDLKMGIYIGPKDNDIFKNNPTYKELGFFHTIAFRGCCCPEAMIRTLAFGIMWLMNILYIGVHNYGVVIIILVFLVRLMLHPITKKSQVSMMRLQKVGPKMEEIKKKYANNPTEMRKKSAEVYREAGANPVMGILPMFLQMPIWIALWTAVNMSINIRGQAFLPFWITDLSAPDHLFRFPGGFNVPFFGEYFNLLPILMGVVMFLQQKLMPHNTSAQTNPQAAQQQKMMMIMMPLMFPLMLYKGPSGVNLYILSSITAGVVEQMVTRKHIKEKEELQSQGLVAVTSKTGGKVKKKKPKPFYKS